LNAGFGQHLLQRAAVAQHPCDQTVRQLARRQTRRPDAISV
jgi:hypothetical protein